MFKNRSRVFFALMLSLSGFNASAALPEIPWAMNNNCKSPKSITVEPGPIVALTAFSTEGKDIFAVEHPRSDIQIRSVYNLSAASAGSVEALKAMRDVARAAYMSGSLVAYCYTSGPVGGIAIVHAIALVDSD